MADADRDSDIGDDSPVSARSEGETSGEHSYESSDEGVARDSRPHHQHQEQTHQALSLTPLQTPLHTINHHTVVNHQLNNHQQLNNLQMNHQAVNNHQLLNNHQLNHHLRRNTSRPLERDSNMSRGSLTTNGGSAVTIRDDFESLKSSIHPHLSSLASLAQGPVPGPSAVFGVASSSASGGFQYATPAFLAPAPPPPPQPTGSNSSSTSSEGSAAGWSFEEQYKQVRQLYELSDDPGRKEFLDDLFAFMQKEGSPINRLPIMAKSVLDLYELYRLVIARGGLVEVINKKLWQEIIKGLNLPSSITSAAFTLRTQYMKFLYRYECEKNKLSTTKELEVAIESNKREGRRSSGQYEAQAQAQAQAQVQAQVQAQALAMMVLQQQQNGRGIPSPLSQLPPQMQSLALAMASSVPGMPGMAVMPGMPGLPRLPLPPLPAIPTHPHVTPQEMEYRVREYLRLLQQNSASSHGGESQESGGDMNGHSGLLSPGAAAMNALEVQRMALWSLYNNNTSQPDLEPQREALNLSDSPHSGCTKREASSPLPQAKRRATRPDSPQPSLHSASPHRDRQLSSPPRPQSARSSPAGAAARHSSRDLSPPGPSGLGRSRSSSSPGPSGLRQSRVLSSPGPAALSHPMVNGHSPVSRPAAFKLTTRGDPSTGDQQLDVSIEINGVTYAGVLFPSSQSSEEDQDRRHLIS